MATLLSFRRMLAPSDDFYNPTLAAVFSGYASTGAKNVSWGGSFATDFVQRTRTAKSYSASFASFSNFKVLTQSAIVNRVGYQVIFDPAVASGTGFYTFAPVGGVSRGNTPWDAVAAYDSGNIPLTGVTLNDIVTGAYNPSPGQYEWFTDGTDLIFYSSDLRQYLTQGSEEYFDRIYYFDGRNWVSLFQYYEGNGSETGVNALFGFIRWTRDGLPAAGK